MEIIETKITTYSWFKIPFLLNKTNIAVHDQLNIYPEEAEMLRNVAYDLVALWRILYELKDNSSQATRLRSNTKNKDV